MALTSPPRGVSPGDLLLVVHDFDARGSDELTLRRGEKIELVELDDGFGDGWYLGKELKGDTVGLFPGVYTTTAPKIPTRPQRDTSETDPSRPEGETEASAYLAPNATDLLSSPKSGDSTPHVSRHASLSDIRSSDQESESAAPSSNPSPCQPQRSSSSPLPSSKLVLDLHHSLHRSIDGHLNGQTKDSPVMNETLSVIDEHITDLSTPRHSAVITQEPKSINDSASEYSSTLDHRMSYINGQETDEEEEEGPPTETEVRHWNQAYTAKHLRDLGVDARHCDIFEEQEITGDVLLDMNQDFIFMKEFDFGVMGRRLKTWHKIKAFQEEVKGTSLTQSRKTSRGSASGFATPEERTLSRAGPPGPYLPRIPTLRGSTASAQQHPRLVSSSNMASNASSPMTPQTPGSSWMDHSRRPSAASIREINHSRRHSSIDATNRMSGAGDSPPQPSHQGKGSFDRAWTMSGGSQRRPGTALAATNDPILPQHVFRGGPESNGSDSAVVVSDDLDRGYFSGPEGDPRRTKKLQKRHSIRSGSFNSGPTSLADLNVRKRHSRVGSADSIRDANLRVPPATKPAATPAPPKSRIRSLSTRLSERPSQQASQAAGEEKSASSGFFSSFAPLVSRHDSDPASRSTTVPFQQQIKNAGRKFPRAVGLRAMSDVVGKGIDTSVPPASPVRDADPSSARTGSTTPSTTKSSERHSTDGSNKAGEGGGISLPRTRTVKSGVKSKKDTSAYTRGLEKKSPQEQMQGCEFSGWMKKRSSNLMTTWKPRLFVLRGRRLSYYYSENDTEERGLIDITAHRVLRADNDPIIALHATITGATASPTSPASSAAASDLVPSDKASGSESSQRTPKNGGGGAFFFKLVPPKTGTSRTVQFTKPAIHYFQVDSAKEGRLWMAALMKATIERDMEVPVETTNKQRTISLKEARLMSQRPPELMPPGQAGEEKVEEPPTPAEEADETDVKGLGLDEVSQINGDDAEEKRTSNPLGGLDTGSPSLTPESVTKTE